MLLTSSQVSVAVSSSVVILCTSALFFSGYAIQQRTLRDLRRAIKEPDPPPPPQVKLFLPDRFSKMTTELEDGTVVVIDSDNDGSKPPAGQSTEPERQDQAVVEVKPSVPGAEDQKQLPLAGGETKQEEQGEHGRVEESHVESQEQEPKKAADSQNKDQSIWNKMRNGKNQKKNSKKDDKKDDKKNNKKKEKPISKAERRKRIKDELRRLSQSEKPILYQRRLY